MDRVKDILISINSHADAAGSFFNTIDEKLKEQNLNALTVRNHDSTRVYRAQNCDPIKLGMAIDRILRTDLGLTNDQYIARVD